jgi:hypothetical protein
MDTQNDMQAVARDAIDLDSQQKRIQRNAYRWNSAGGTLFALQSVIMLIVLTRVCDVYTAGVFTIAVNTGPLPDDALLSQGADLLFHSMQELCDEWEMVVNRLKN